MKKNVRYRARSRDGVRWHVQRIEYVDGLSFETKDQAKLAAFKLNHGPDAPLSRQGRRAISLAKAAEAA